MDDDQLDRDALVRLLAEADAGTQAATKATGLTRGLPEWKERAGRVLTGGVDTLLGALGLGDETHGNLLGQLLSAGMPMAGGLKAVRGAKAPIKAYHGSPHDFDQFSLSKIGTGEGAQAYGHGLYFADSEGVARNYRDALSAGGDLPLKADPSIKVPHDYAQSSPARRAEIRAEFQRMSEATWADEAARERAAKQVRAFDAFEKSPETTTPGRMYEVNIHADPDDFLDWDAPLSQQSEKVQKAIGVHARPRDFDAELAAKPGTPEYEAVTRQMDTRIGSPGVPDATGAQFFRDDVLRQTAKDEVGRAAHLKAQGIPGIKYLDGASRSAGQGSRNYVVFDDKLISIVKKYGIAAALSAGAISETQAKQMKEQGYQ